MEYLIRHAMLFVDGVFVRKDILVRDGLIADISDKLPASPVAVVYDMNNCFVFPGLIDVHVHLREPGFSYKETVLSGTLAAARGGFTTVLAMPNLNPVPDSVEHLTQEIEIIRKDARVRVFPYASITMGQKQQALSDMAALAQHTSAFTDDGVGVESAELMEEAMRKAKALGSLIVAHCEVKELAGGGCVHDGGYARTHGLRGNPSESEWREVERDIDLVRKTGCGLHICHVSTKESVALIREAKAEGLPVSCETAPHYLVLCDEDLQDDGRFKMNPPIRGRADRDALLTGLQDGTVDMIATDHAPHSAEEKAGGLQNSLNGIIGLETAFPILYTRLVKTGELALEKLIDLMQVQPAARFGLGSPLELGKPADLTVFDLNEDYVIDPMDFLSKGKSSPFTGEKVFGRCLLTMVDGRPVWEDVRVKKGKAKMKKGLFVIESNTTLTESVYKMTLSGDTSAITAPGQFVNIAVEWLYLRRPISVCDLAGERLTLVYKTVGKGTEKMAAMLPGQTLELLSGLGNGYDTAKSGDAPLLIGGGVGVPPLYLLAKRLLAQGKRPRVLLGFNRAAEVFLEADFQTLGLETVVTTADGSYGIRGFVTDALKIFGRYSYIYACGPEAMLRAVYDATETEGQYSFEERMGCGFGGCMGCSCETRYGYKRICKEGPVLEKGEILW